MGSHALRPGVRADLVDAQDRVMAMLGEPGLFWNAAERIAIASEVRRSHQHRDLPPWQAPSQTDGLSPSHLLPAAAVDAVWRISNHPGTLTESWHTEIIAALPSPLHYVELVAVVAMVNGVDRFAEILNFEPLPLPQPGDGAPTGASVETSVSAHWVPTADIGGPNVLLALSAVPELSPIFLALSAAQYVPREALTGDLEWGRNTIDRRQIELVAAQTSLVNECFY